MALVRNGAVTDDDWRRLADDAPVPDDGAVIVGLARWRAERARLIARGGRLGVRVPSDAPIGALVDDLPHLALVAFEFVKFSDGRPFTQARLLRERHGFQGEIRAVGDVLRDQLAFLARAGFDAFELDAAAARGVPRALGEITVAYQPAADGTPRRFLRRP